MIMNLLSEYDRSRNCRVSPYSINIELTEKCFLRCPECYQNRTIGKDMEYQLFMKIVDDAANAGVRRILLSGGDPLLYPNLAKAVKYAKSKSMECYLSTSGYGLTDNILVQLKDSGLDAIHISINGSSREINQLSRDGFDCAVKALSLLNGYGIKTVINWVAHHDNIIDFENMIQIGQKYGVANIDVLSLKHM